MYNTVGFLIQDRSYITLIWIFSNAFWILTVVTKCIIIVSAAKDPNIALSLKMLVFSTESTDPILS